jgi:hypothetical protein
MNSVKMYLIHIGDCLSQLANCAIFLGDNPNESLSGRAFRQRNGSKFWSAMYRLINKIFFWQDNHCLDAHLLDKQRARRMLDDD